MTKTKKFVVASLITNVVVLIPVCSGLLMDAAWVADGYGGATAARGILLSIYGAILIVSLGLLFRQDPILVAPLLLVQVIYKFTTPLTVGTFTNPVVLSNLAIATLHLVTLVFIYHQLGRHGPHQV